MISAFIDIFGLIIILSVVWSGRKNLVSLSLPSQLILIGLLVLSVEPFLMTPWLPAFKPYWMVLMVIYYISVSVAVVMLLWASLDIAQCNRFTFKILLLLLLCITSFLLVIPGQNSILSGVAEMEYTVTRVKGNLYWVWQFVATLGAIGSVCVNFYAYKRRTGRDRTLAKALLFACAPSAMLGTTIIVLMELGFQINAVGLLNLVWPLVPYVLINPDKCERFLMLIPLTAENRRAADINDNLFAERNLNERLESVERMIIKKTLEETSGNRSATAKELGMSRPTLIRKISGIEKSDAGAD